QFDKTLWFFHQHILWCETPYPILGLETVLFSLFLPSKNHNLHAGITCRMMRCNACMSLRFGSGWLVIYFLICSCIFICLESDDLMFWDFRPGLGRDVVPLAHESF